MGLADSFNILGYYGYLSPREGFSKAKVAAVRALEDEALAEAHNSLAFVRLLYDWDWQDAERQFKKALKLNPDMRQRTTGMLNIWQRWADPTKLWRK